MVPGEFTGSEMQRRRMAAGDGGVIWVLIGVGSLAAAEGGGERRVRSCFLAEGSWRREEEEGERLLVEEEEPRQVVQRVAAAEEGRGGAVAVVAGKVEVLLRVSILRRLMVPDWKPPLSSWFSW